MNNPDNTNAMQSNTTNQSRDNLMEFAPLTTVAASEIKRWAQQANEDRISDAETYRKCPRCYGHHSVRDNFDDLCDPCQQTIMENFPNHESVPYIKAALAVWFKDIKP